MTAGFALNGLTSWFVLDEWRGQSAMIGGDFSAITIPNILSHFSSNLQGPSIGHHLVELPGWV